MNSKTTIALLVIAVGLFSFIWFFERKIEPTKDRIGRAQRVLRFQSADVSKIEIQRRDAPDRSLTLEKRGDRWELTAPLAARASNDAVEPLLTALEYLDWQRRFTEKEVKSTGMSDAERGLEAPRMTIVLTAAGKPVKLLVGAETPVGGQLYLRAEGAAELLQSRRASDVFIVRKDLMYQLDKSVADYRDRTVLDLYAWQLSKLEIRTADPAAGARRIAAAKTDNKWRLTQPLTARADGRKIEDLVGKITALRREDFTDDAPSDLKPYGLDEPAVEVTLVGSESDGAKILLLGAPVPDHPDRVYAKRKEEHSVFTVRAEILEQLKAQPNDLRERHLADFHADDVTSIELTASEQQTRLRRNGEWRLTAPESAATEEGTAKNLLDALDSLEAKEFVADVASDLAAFGLDAPALRVTLHKDPPAAPPAANAETPPPPAAPLLELLFGKTDADKGIVFAKRGDEPFVYGVPTDAFAALPKSELDFRQRWVLRLPKEQIHAVTITRPDASFRIEKRNGQWSLAEPAEGALDNDALENILTLLTALRAEQWIARLSADTSLVPYGLDAPQLTLVVETLESAPASPGAVPAPQPPPSKVHALRVGNEKTTATGSLRYARLNDQPLLFLLSPFAVEQLSRPLVATPKAEPETKPEPAPAPAETPAQTQ